MRPEKIEQNLQPILSEQPASQTTAIYQDSRENGLPFRLIKQNLKVKNFMAHQKRCARSGMLVLWVPASSVSDL
jgi:hypothetical protein